MGRRFKRGRLTATASTPADLVRLWRAGWREVVGRSAVPFDPTDLSGLDEAEPDAPDDTPDDTKENTPSGKTDD